MTHVSLQERVRNQVHSGHIVNRRNDLETAYDQMITRCYNRKKDGSLGYWKRSKRAGSNCFAVNLEKT
jgi:hypothetical protein